MANETCGNCKYSSRWTMTNHAAPRINKNHSGTCAYEIPEPIWPLSIRQYDRRLPKAGGVQADETGCPCWAMKEEDNAK